MGVKSCKKGEVLWDVSGLTLKSLKSLHHGNRIDVDGNGLIWTLFHQNSNQKKSFIQLIHIMAEYLKNIAFSGGFIITVVVDGDIRPDCKRDSWDRIKTKELEDINRRYCRLKALNLYSKINQNTATEDEKKDYPKFSKAAKYFENKCTNSHLKMPKDFHTLLSDQLMIMNACQPNANGGFVKENILKAKFQADSAIARRSILGKSDFIMSKDSDFPCLLGKECILLHTIHEQKGKKKRGRKRKSDEELASNSSLRDATVFQVGIAGSDNMKMNALRSQLHNNEKNHEVLKCIQWNEAKLPLFKYSNPTLRGVIAVAMGCDAYKEGVKGMGSSKISKSISNIMSKEKISDIGEGYEESLIPLLKQHFINQMKPQPTEADYDALVAAFLYEPGIVLNDSGYSNFINGNDSTSADERIIQSTDYIFGTSPTTLPSYLKSFASPSVQIDADSASIHFCKGSHCQRGHSYLVFEGSHKCSACEEVFCKTCSFVPSDDDRKKIHYRDCKSTPLCLKCFRDNWLGGGDDTSSATTPNQQQQAEAPSLNEMNDILSKQFGIPIDKKADVAETIDIYDTYVSSPDNIRNTLLNAVATVQYPIHPARVLGAQDESFQKIGSFSFSEGGRFISNEKLIPNDKLPSVLQLISSFIEYDLSKIVPGARNVDYSKYDHFPTMFINFAYLSRIDEGFRLLERAARHAGDSRTPSIFNETAELFQFAENGELYHISNKIERFEMKLTSFFTIHVLR